MSVRFGATICQLVPFPLLRDDFVFAESIGLDNAWVIDQFGIDGVPEVPLLEAWTTLAALAGETERIRIGAMVTNVSMRHPGILAKSILTVDQISGGRVDAAAGGGFYPLEHAALGVDFLDGPGRGERLREAVAILDRALRGDTVTFDGVHYRLSDATFRPTPTQLPRPPLWVAAQSTRSLRVAVRYADVVISLGEEGRGIEESLPVFRARMERVTSCVWRRVATRRRYAAATSPAGRMSPSSPPWRPRLNWLAATSGRGRPTSRSTSTTPPSRSSKA